MVLPPEMVDEILIHLRRDKQALQNCSLVAKSWTYPSQKLLYTRIHITPSTYRTWQEIAFPTSAELLQHAHSLTCFRIDSLHGLHEDYLKSFHRLQELNLDQVFNIELDTVNLFPAFQNTLSSLSLSRVSLTLDAFIKLLGYFPNLRELRLTEPVFDSEHRTVPPPSTSPRGTLSLFLSSARNTDILLRGLCELEPEYNELHIYELGDSTSTSSVHTVISACEKTLTHLQLGLRDYSIYTLENLSELRELTFGVSHLLPEQVSLVSTTTSTNIQKVVFSPLLQHNWGDQFWSPLDIELNRLLDRLRASGYKHTLEIKFRCSHYFAERLSGAGADWFQGEGPGDCLRSYEREGILLF